MRTSILRVWTEGLARVTNEELFFDLVYAFAVTQLSHRLLGHIDARNGLEDLILWGAVWLGWQYTAWVTNWIDPRLPRVRIMLFTLMLLALLMGSAIPGAFGERGGLFATAYVLIQVGRTLFVLVQLPYRQPLSANFRRILGWLCISGTLWLTGSFQEGATRVAFWVGAVVCEYLSPMVGFWLPGLGRSRSADWDIDGGHLAERCQLFVMMALGESVVVTGATATQRETWDLPAALALGVSFVTSVALWWIYFDTSSRAGARAIERADDVGRMGARFHYVHIGLIGAIIVVAVGNELALEGPGVRTDAAAAWVLLGGPFAYLACNMVYQHIVNGTLPRPYLWGLCGFFAVAPVALLTDRLVAAALAALLLISVALWEGCRVRRPPGSVAAGPNASVAAPRDA